jgi:hypothetical protein
MAVVVTRVGKRVMGASEGRVVDLGQAICEVLCGRPAQPM